MSGCWPWKCSVVRKGRQRTVLVNEIAPRVHNSGHWTIDGATGVTIRTAAHTAPLPAGGRLASANASKW